MYPVSAAYKTAIQQNVRDIKITGTITLKDDTIINITDEDIVQGSLYVTEQCVAGEDIEVGNVYASEMGLSLSTPIANPYSLDGARIHIYFGIDVGSLWEYVPLGYFYVTEIQRKANNVNLTALDGMLLFDIPVGDPGSSSPRNFVVHACDLAGVTLGTSVFEIDTFANATLLFAAPDASKIKTCRDLLMWACQIMGAFARMNRSGQLEIVPIKARSSVKTINKAERFNSDVSDFAVKITKVSMQVGEAEYSRGTEGMTMVLDENPLMAGLSETQINQMLDYFLAQITTAVYVPFNSNFIGDPALQPGDYVTLSDTSVLGSGDVASIITHSTWRYRGPHNLKAAGKHGLVRGVQNQQIKAVSSIVAIARAAQDLALAANQSTQLIKDAIGGHVLIRQSPDETNEILIMDHPDPDQAVKIWRWNMGGLGYSDNVVGADNPDREYTIAMTMDGAINANFIKTGQLDAGVVRIGPESYFAPGYDPTQISSASMGVDSDCTALFHFDGSLNSHKGLTPSFTRDSAAYLSDGTQVPAGQARFEGGKFGKAARIEEGTTNLLTANQSSIETDTTGFTAFSGTTISRDTTTYKFGSASLKVVTPATDWVGFYTTLDTPAVAGNVYIGSLYLKGAVGGEKLRIYLQYFNNSFVQVGRSSVVAATLTTSFQRFAIISTAPAETAYANIIVYNNGALAQTYYVDGLQIEQKPYATSWQIGGTLRNPEKLTIPNALNPRKGTINIWHKWDNLNQFDWKDILCNNVAYNAANSFRLVIKATEGTVYVNLPDNTMISKSFPRAVITTDWQMYTVVYDADEGILDVYIDGALVTNGQPVNISTLNLETTLHLSGTFGDIRYGANGLRDELRIDKIARTDAEIRGWYKANAPFYTSEDQKQLPGYLKAETDGIKVYDSSDALRVLLGSWLSGAIRKYGLKIIGGEIYSTSIQTGQEGDAMYIALEPPNKLVVYSPKTLGSDIPVKMFELAAHHMAERAGMTWYDADGLYYGVLVGEALNHDMTLSSVRGKLSLLGFDGIDLSGDTHVSGTLTATNKSNVELTDSYGLILLTVRESPDHRYIDEGVGVLVNGVCRVDIDPVFLECIEPNTSDTRWNIQLTPYGKAMTYIDEIGEDYFVVKDYHEVADGIEFSWSLSATRRDYANIRFVEVV